MSHRMVVSWLVLLTVAPTVAAQQRRGRGFGEGVVFLVGLREVQQELELSDPQRELLDALRADLRTQVQVAFRGGNRSRRDEGSERTEVRNRIREINRQGEEMVLLVLEPEQATRLKQLRLQQEGTRAFDRAETAKALGLTEAQRTQIQEIRNSARANPEDVSREQRRARRRQTERDILAVLSEEQRERWETMQGERFQFRLRRIGRFDRRPGSD